MIKNIKDTPENIKSLQMVFLIVGLAFVVVGINYISDSFDGYLGYLMIGNGVASIGYAFGPEFFLKKWGPDNHLPKKARIVTAIGYSIVVIGGAYSYLNKIL